MEIEADYYFAAGDLSNWGRGLDAIGEVLALRGNRVYVLPGNHESEQHIEHLCLGYGLNPFHGRAFDAGGYHMAGLGYSTPTPFHTPGEYPEEEMARRLAPFSALNSLVLICHSPPWGTELDRMGRSDHAGSHAVREFIERHEPVLFFCGHIHEAHGRRALLGRTQAYNTGKQGVLIDFDRLKV